MPQTTLLFSQVKFLPLQAGAGYHKHRNKEQELLPHPTPFFFAEPVNPRPLNHVYTMSPRIFQPIRGSRCGVPASSNLTQRSLLTTSRAKVHGVAEKEGFDPFGLVSTSFGCWHLGVLVGLGVHNPGTSHIFPRRI